MNKYMSQQATEDTKGRCSGNYIIYQYFTGY